MSDTILNTNVNAAVDRLPTLWYTMVNSTRHASNRKVMRKSAGLFLCRYLGGLHAV